MKYIELIELLAIKKAIPKIITDLDNKYNIFDGKVETIETISLDNILLKIEDKLNKVANINEYIDFKNDYQKFEALKLYLNIFKDIDFENSDLKYYMDILKDNTPKFSF